jgi:hypothetical protein
MTTKKTTTTVAGAVSSATTTAASTASATVSGVSGSAAGIPVTKPRPGLRDDLQALLDGLESVIPDGSTIPTATGGFAKSTVVTQLQQWLALYTTVDQAVLTLKGDRQALTDGIAPAKALYAALKAALQGYFGPGSPTLEQFGFVPKKPRAKATGQQLAARAVKSAGTRQIRGTVGPKKKLQTRFAGTVTPAVAASPQPAQTAAVTAPAAPASPAGSSIVKTSA